MFKLQGEATFWATAPISVPGQAAPVPLEVEYRWLGKSGLRTFFEGISDKSDAQVLSEVVVSWKGVDAEYSADNLDRLLDLYPTAADAMFTAFKDELLKAKEKN